MFDTLPIANRGESRGRVVRDPRTEEQPAVILGPKSNLPFFAELLDYPEFVTGRYDTGIVGRMRG